MRIITFLSDFGNQDGYVGAVKGVLFHHAPKAGVVDISHEIRPFQIEEAAYVLMSYYQYYAKDTVHLVVVDPGVGSLRKPIVVRTANYFFVGPDNGVFSYILRSEANTVYEIDAAKVRAYNFGRSISRTFHGRDLFAPVAAFLAAGGSIHKLAKKLDGAPVVFDDHLKAGMKKVSAKIISIDRFGNLITNFSKFEFDQLQNVRITDIEIKDKRLEGLQPTYSAVSQGEVLALWGSAGFLEISVNRGSAAELLKAQPGKTEVVIHLKND